MKELSFHPPPIYEVYWSIVARQDKNVIELVLEKSVNYVTKTYTDEFASAWLISSHDEPAPLKTSCGLI